MKHLLYHHSSTSTYIILYFPPFLSFSFSLSYILVFHFIILAVTSRPRSTGIFFFLITCLIEKKRRIIKGIKRWMGGWREQIFRNESHGKTSFLNVVFISNIIVNEHIVIINNSNNIQYFVVFVHGTVLVYFSFFFVSS